MISDLFGEASEIPRVLHKWGRGCPQQRQPPGKQDAEGKGLRKRPFFNRASLPRTGEQAGLFPRSNLPPLDVLLKATLDLVKEKAGDQTPSFHFAGSVGSGPRDSDRAGWRGARGCAFEQAPRGHNARDLESLSSLPAAPLASAIQPLQWVPSSISSITWVPAYSHVVPPLSRCRRRPWF